MNILVAGTIDKLCCGQWLLVIEPILDCSIFIFIKL